MITYLQTTAPIAFNVVYLIFLLIPGYVTLRGYQRARVRLDTLSRLDKLLTTVTGGAFTLFMMLMLHRFGALQWSVEVWYAYLDSGVYPQPNFYFSSDNGVRLNDANRLTLLVLLTFISAQSAIGFVSGWILGRFIYYLPWTHSQSATDLEQPWETAVRQSAIGDPLTVITHGGREIEGTLYRIGSPSERYDLLLAVANEVIRLDGKVKEHRPLGVTYHHFEDISQVQFPEITPEQPTSGGGFFVRGIKSLLLKARELHLKGRIKSTPEFVRFRIEKWRFDRTLRDDIQSGAAQGFELDKYRRNQ